jgi:transposase
VARSSGAVRFLEDRLQPVLELVAARALGSDFQGTSVGGRRGWSHHRRIGHTSPPGFCGRKRGVISNALGRSRGGVSTKVHALVDTKGRPLHVQLTPGQQHESTVAEEIIANHARGKAFIADTGYDSDAIRAQLKALRIKAVIHPNPTRKKKPCLDRTRYANRYRVEVFFHTLKRFRAIATRFEKTSRNYLALIHVACSFIWLQELLGGA